MHPLSHVWPCSQAQSGARCLNPWCVLGFWLYSAERRLSFNVQPFASTSAPAGSPSSVVSTLDRAMDSGGLVSAAFAFASAIDPHATDTLVDHRQMARGEGLVVIGRGVTRGAAMVRADTMGAVEDVGALFPSYSVHVWALQKVHPDRNA